MDINKEREAFESVFTAENGWDLTCINGCYQNIGTFKAFAGWQAAKEHATAEGFVLVRKELPEKIAEALALERVEKPVTETDPTWIKISEDAYKERIQSKKWELWRDYKAMVEAQEQSHD